MEWIDINDMLPEIPKGRNGVEVIVATLDSVYAEISGGIGYSVYQASYGFMNHLPLGFKELCDDQIMPTGDPVTHWMYLPEPPIKMGGKHNVF